MGAINIEYLRRERQRVRDADRCQHASEDLCILAAAIDEEDDVAFRLALQGHQYNETNLECLGYALQAASLKNHHPIVELLLTHRADINFVGGTYETALQAAIIGGHVQMVERLLQCGAMVNHETPIFCTPLQSATAFGQRRIAHTLLKYGANANQLAGSYHTALQIASIEGQSAITEDLLEHGADVSIQGGFYGNALRAAVLVGHIPLPEGFVFDRDHVKQLPDHCRALAHANIEPPSPHLQICVMLLRALQNA